MDLSRLLGGLLPMLMGQKGGAGAQPSNLGQALGGWGQQAAAPSVPKPAQPVPNLSSMMQNRFNSSPAGRAPTGDEVKGIMGTDNAQSIMQGLMRFMPGR